jgi:hypothetical protein
MPHGSRQGGKFRGPTRRRKQKGTPGSTATLFFQNDQQWKRICVLVLMPGVQVNEPTRQDIKQNCIPCDQLSNRGR